MQVEEEKEACGTIRTVDPMEEYMIFRCLPNQIMGNFNLDLKITLRTNSPYFFCLYLLVEPLMFFGGIECIWDDVVLWCLANELLLLKEYKYGENI